MVYYLLFFVCSESHNPTETYVGKLGCSEYRNFTYGKSESEIHVVTQTKQKGTFRCGI